MFVQLLSLNCFIPRLNEDRLIWWFALSLLHTVYDVTSSQSRDLYSNTCADITQIKIKADHNNFY